MTTVVKTLATNHPAAREHIPKRFRIYNRTVTSQHPERNVFTGLSNTTTHHNGGWADHQLQSEMVFELPTTSVTQHDVVKDEQSGCGGGALSVHLLTETHDKGALSFILSSSSDSEEEDEETKSGSNPTGNGFSRQIKRKRVITATVADIEIKTEYQTDEPPSSTTLTSTTPSRPPLTKKGSKFCIVEGCTSRAKHAKRCWKHGGSVKCKVADCINRAKSKGVCWSHGGGTTCSFENCDTISVSNGFCWAHGGGKRCVVEKCSKPAYERTQNYCTAHYEELVGGKR